MSEKDTAYHNELGEKKSLMRRLFLNQVLAARPVALIAAAVAFFSALAAWVAVYK